MGKGSEVTMLCVVYSCMLWSKEDNVSHHKVNMCLALYDAPLTAVLTLAAQFLHLVFQTSTYPS